MDQMFSSVAYTCTNGELMGPDGVDWENKKKENNSLKAGDTRIVWCFGGKSLW